MSRSVVVIGASRGIGAAIAARFVAGGDQVLGTGRTAAPNLEGATGAVCDITDTASVDAALSAAEERNGTPEIVVLNAGITKDALLLQATEDDYLSVVDTNLNGAWRVVKRALRPMTRQRRGCFVFISSVAGHTGSPGQANYAAAKAGLDGLARTVAREYARRNIRANVVAPGPIDTDMTRALSDEQRDRLVSEIPLGRLGTADEVADTVWWVAGASFVTGAYIPVAGGLGIGF